MTRVLVVDDERKMRRVLQILLEQMGLESIPVKIYSSSCILG